MANFPGPQWLRLPDAVERVGRVPAVDDQEARAWIVRTMADLLPKYDKQELFRIPAYSGRTRRWFNKVAKSWAAEPKVSWAASTIRAPHPVRIIDADLIIEVFAEVLGAMLMDGASRQGKTQCPPKAYEQHWNEVINRTKLWPSDDEDDLWAKQKCSDASAKTHRRPARCAARAHPERRSAAAVPEPGGLV